MPARQPTAVADRATGSSCESPVFLELHPPLTDEQAFLESSRCLECGGPYGRAPCIDACPANIEIPWFIREIREGRPADAARTIFAENALGGSCARVCPVEELCERACVLEKEGRRAVRIGQLQRYAADWAIQREIPVLPKSSQPPMEGRIAIVGAGPASLACAAELALLGYQPVIYERRSLPGGLITYGIAPYKQHFKPIPWETEQIERLGVEFKYGVAIGTDYPIDAFERDHDAIFLGIGLGADLTIAEADRPLKGVLGSLQFVEQLKIKGVADLRQALGERVVVIGGGNTAIDVAREAIRLGVPEVTIVYRRTREVMPAYQHEVNAAIREGVRCLWLSAPTKLIGKDRVEGVECVSLRMTDPGDGRRSKLEPIKGTESVLEADAVVLAIGQQRLADFLGHINNLKLDHGLIAVNELGRTTADKYFAGGDCVNGGDTVVRAVADGKRAAHGINRFLKGGLQ